MKPKRLFGPLAILAGAGLVVAGLRRERSHALDRSQFVEAPVDEVFAFFSEPRNLEKLTPPWLGFEIIDIDDGPVRPGFRIEYRVRPLGVPQRWVTRIVDVEPGRRFADVQERGPYKYWRHEHAFADVGSGTIVADRVEYALPFGVAGSVAHALVVSRQLDRIFEFRRQAIEKLFPVRRPPVAIGSAE